MKRIILIFTIALFYLAACTNSDTHTHNGDTHSHDNTDHSHDNNSESHSHDDDDHGHSHDQEEFTVEADSLKQDSLKNHQ
jgi:Ni/Co efflux regulator RcnB